MKPPMRAATKPQRLLVPVAAFEFEKFEVRVRRVTRIRLASTEVASRKVDPQFPSTQCKTIFRPDSDRPAKILLPSPWPQGPGLMRLRLEARPVAHPAALPSGDFDFETGLKNYQGPTEPPLDNHQ